MMTEAAAKASTPVTCSSVFLLPPKLKKKKTPINGRIEHVIRLLAEFF